MVCNIPNPRFFKETASTDRNAGADLKLLGDLRTLIEFVSIYCKSRHRDRARSKIELKTLDMAAIHGGPVLLCSGCSKLLAHAVVKRSRCPMNPKPACKNCPQHCYHPGYRREIQKVMRFSGCKMLLSGRLSYLLHFLF